ncbi:N-acetyltransferase [Synechococcus sp. MIT S1220]|uniref:N-acetyltransferase n=1 Tax=Synechococcus sp. MIT S1220 TaxID=3082549 RepID=UPI0039AF243E
MLPFFQQPVVPRLPSGYVLETTAVPTAAALNHLLASCEESTHPEQHWERALESSLWQLSIIEESSGELVGFVRATSDLALNANLWNLSARPGPDQQQLFTVLVHRALHILRRDLPGCSLSVSAPSIAIAALETNGFVIDPGGIRAMGLQLKSPKTSE